MKRLSVIMLVVSLLLVVNSVGFAENLRVGWTVAYFDHPVYQVMMEAMKEVAKEEDIELVMVDGRNDPSVQSQQIDNFLAQGMDGIMITAAVADPMLPAIRRINQANVPLVVVDRRIFPRGQNVHWDALVTWDMVLSGSIGGAQVVHALKGQGNLVVVEGTPGAGSTIDRGNAFYEVIEKFPGINVIYKTSADFNRAKGLQVTEDILQRFPKGEIDAIYYMNDEMALGGLQAIKDANRIDDFAVISVDGDRQAMQALRNGEIDYEAIFHPADHAVAINIMARILRGEDPDLENLTYKGRTMDLVEADGMPWVRPTVYWVDERNADEDGYEGF